MAESKVKEAKQAYKQKSEALEDTAIELQSKGEEYYEKNKQTINGIIIAIVAIVGGYFAYQNFVLKPMIAEANEASWKAQAAFEKDSFALALNGGADFMGFEEITDEYSSAPVGNLAHYYAGICELHLGNYEQAISYLESFSSQDPNLKSIAFGATGDAYAQLKDYDNAIAQYQKAADVENDFTSPIYLMKAGQLLELNQDYQGALEAYQTLKNDYGKSEEARTIDKYIARAEGLASK